MVLVEFKMDNKCEKVLFRETFKEFEQVLQEHEVVTQSKFILVDSRKEFTLDKDRLDMKKKIRWKDDIPYLHFGSRTYACHQGRDTNLYQKKKYIEKRDHKACIDNQFTKRYNLSQVTKKLDCPAKIHVSRIMRFCAFKILGKITEHEKAKVSKKIRDSLQKDDIGEMGYLFNLPTRNSHQNHLIGPESSSVEPIDRRVREQINKLVNRGERSAAVIKRILISFVENHLQEYDQTRRRFYPDQASIRNIIYSAKSNIRNSPIDHENVEIMLNKLDRTKHHVFFRPCAISGITDDKNLLNYDAQLLFVYQSADMHHLYRKYGAYCILLDGTYRACKYAVPLYFIVVETNVNFQVVGVIITQFETREAITEGLSTVKSWNPDIHPQYGMVDLAAEEISSLETVFPSIKVFICSFHREQAWHRWLSRSCHSGIPKKETLDYLRKVVNAPTQEELEIALQNLRTWEVFQKTDLKMYFEGTWHKEIQRWALAFKPVDMYQNINNGVEKMNKELKYGYLEGLKECSLSELIEVLIKSFLPERYTTYINENVKMSSLLRKYGSNLPAYLHGRPKWIIDHVMSKLGLLQDANVEIDMNISEEGVFQVPSLSQDLTYTVHLNEQLRKCSCTCHDFRMDKLICKHIILVGVKVPTLHLSAVHTWVFENPIFLIDEDVVKPNKESTIPTSSMANPVSHENQDTPSLSIIENQNTTSYNQFSLRGSSKQHLINDCNATIRSIQSVLWHLNENNLHSVSSSLKYLFQDISSKVEKDSNTGLPIESHSATQQAAVLVATTAGEVRLHSQPSNTHQASDPVSSSEFRRELRQLKSSPKKGLTNRVGAFVDMMKEHSYISAMEDPDGPEQKKKKMMPFIHYNIPSKS